MSRVRLGNGRSVVAALTVAVLASDCAWIGHVSVDKDGAVPNGQSLPSGVSADGRYVAFTSRANNMVAGDTNNRFDAFVRDMVTGTNTLVSVAQGGPTGNGDSGAAGITPDGRHVVFASSASNLVSGDTNNRTDVFVRDLQAGTTTLVSVASNGDQADESSSAAAISADGRFVVFYSMATNLVPGGLGGDEEVYLRDLQSQSTVILTSGHGNDLLDSSAPSISADGRYVVFDTAADDLAPGDTPDSNDVFLHDRIAGTTTRISNDFLGSNADGDSSNAAISSDGRYVAFDSSASDLVLGEVDANATSDIFLYDRIAAATTRITHDTNRLDPDNVSLDPSLSADGRYVAYQSNASDLVAEDGNASIDIFVHDRTLDRTIRVSQGLVHNEADDASTGAFISGDGRYVAFGSVATNLGGNTNDDPDAFLKYARLVTVQSINPSSVPRGATDLAVTISGSGFETGGAVNLLPPSGSRAGGATISDVTLVSDTEITGLLTVDADAAVGGWEVRVRHAPTVLGTTKVALGACGGCLQVT